MPLAGKLLQAQKFVGEASAHPTMSSLCEGAISRLGEGNAEVMSKAEMQVIKKSMLAATMETRMMVTRPIQFGMTTLRWLDSDTVDLDALKGLVPRTEAPFYSSLESLINMGVEGIPKDTMLLAGWDYACLQKLADRDVAERFLAGRLAELNDYTSRKIYSMALILMEIRERR